MKQARIYVNDNFCGILTEDEEGFHFAYDEGYLARPDAGCAAVLGGRFILMDYRKLRYALQELFFVR